MSEQRKPTVIYLPAEIEWASDDDVWLLETATGNIKKSNGAHYDEEELKQAVAGLIIEMLAQIESLAAYVDDIETELSEESVNKIHGELRNANPRRGIRLALDEDLR